MSAPEQLFVYGSLKRGFRHHDQLENAEFLGEVRTRAGYTLVSLGSYPALIVSGSDQVRGELYRVDAIRLSRLDLFEGDEYERREVEIECHGIAFAYLLTRGHPAFASAPRIGSFFVGP